MKWKPVSVPFLFFAALVSAVPAPAQQGSSKPTVIPPVSYDISPPLVDLVASAPPEAPTGKRKIPLRRPARPPTAPPTPVTQVLALQQHSILLATAQPG